MIMYLWGGHHVECTTTTHHQSYLEQLMSILDLAMLCYCNSEPKIANLETQLHARRNFESNQM
ncbi:hypothetical protein SCLCIDRAFT_290298 [Scleroderma citrinum Foug A]|uniref:Uncharacterized protein n=1 Tax=Scleroderma citrinum Foug A TaxID=1036808 RepID=A0A0C3DHZ5_9AGAM|nr:hypothetical protein SCLCIDRAFT_290298 [Scleroderma citrinum Foug A]